MYVKAHPPGATPVVNGNKGSCLLLADYLEKENAGKESGKMPFFSHFYDQVSKGTVIKQIDENVRNLGKKDPKFYMLSINPSHYELQHLIHKTTGRKGIQHFGEITDSEKEKVFKAVRDYTRDVMDLYAKNFNRESVKSGADLVYFSKIETTRKWHPWDKEVRNGQAIKGQEKPGLNIHIHVIVSRNDRQKKTKLSPLSKSRGGTQKLNGKDVMQGFNHEVWKHNCGNRFNEKFNYKPRVNEQYSFDSNNHQNEKIAGNGVMKVRKALVSKLKNEATGGQFRDEKATVRNVARAARFIANPQAALMQELKNKFKEILALDALKEK